MALFTAESARLAGLKSVEVRKQRKLTQNEPEQIPAIVSLQSGVSTGDEIATIELSRVRKRLNALDKLMEAAETDREWDNLSRAYERVFRAWVHLAGIPGPGNRRPGPVKDPSRRSRIEPIDPQPCGQEPTTNSVPTSQPQNNTPQST